MQAALARDAARAAEVAEQARLREASEEADQREVHEIYLQSIQAVSSGICAEAGPLVRTDLFDPFAKEATAAIFLFLRDARRQYEDPIERSVFVTAFLNSVEKTIGKIGIRQSRGRLVEPSAQIAQMAVSLIHATHAVIMETERNAMQASAQAAQQAAQQARPALPGFMATRPRGVQAPAGGHPQAVVTTTDKVRALGG